MTSKASGPRRRKSGRTRKFKQDWKRLQRSGRYPMEELKFVMSSSLKTPVRFLPNTSTIRCKATGATTAIATFAVTGC